MWKKTDEDQEPERSDTPAVARAARAPQRAPGASSVPARSSHGGGTATIGPTIQIKGEVSGNEKLHVEGSIEGNVNIKGNEFVVGSQGRLNANASAQTILIEGEVRGDLQATELITLKSNAKVNGSVTAPRIVVEDGCKFKGKIDMEQAAGAPVSPMGAASAEVKATPETRAGGTEAGAGTSLGAGGTAGKVAADT